MFFCEFCEISKNTIFTEQLQWLLLCGAQFLNECIHCKDEVSLAFCKSSMIIIFDSELVESFYFWSTYKKSISS